MSLKSLLMPVISQHLLSERRLERRRAAIEERRRSIGSRHQVTYFHQVDDPYSALAAQLLAPLLRAYDIDLVVHLVSPPADSAAPAREALVAYSRVDAQRLAQRLAIPFRDPGCQPPPEAVTRATALLAGALREDQFPRLAGPLSLGLWQPPFDASSLLSSAWVPAPASPDDVRQRLAHGDALRRQLGHYLGGMFHYGAEWYWGPDRLHHLEDRLRRLGVQRQPSADLLVPPPPDLDRPVALPEPPTIEFFLSLRSPYTAIAAARVFELGRLTGAPVRLRPVMPMVMRGLPVPPEKQRYIADDAAREARSRGVPFGRINDPVGRPVERGMALIPHALAQGRGQEFVLAFLEGVWAHGIDAGSDRGLRRIVERAGLHWPDARPWLNRDDWRAPAEANRQALLALGLWGVPSFQAGSVAVWGQDRLWVIRDEILRGRDAR